MVVNQGQLAEILGKTDVTIWEWQQETPGLPILERGAKGEENKYDTAAVIAWWIEREVRKTSGGSQKDRLTRLQGDSLELELAEKKGVLVPVTEIEPTWQNWVLTAAAFMLSRHSRLASILEAAPGLAAKREILKKEDAEFLTCLGVEGERMQVELDALLGKLAEEETKDFLRRIAGHDDKPNSAGPTKESTGAPDAA